MTRASKSDEKEAQIAPFTGPVNGDVRISWEFVPCGEITVVAQQMKDPNTKENEFTFRQWNPERKDVEWG